MSDDQNTYPYSKYIKSPEKLGASPSPKALSTDIKALISYVEVLVSGESKAQNVSPLGNKYFMDTGGKCKDSAGVEHPRYVYINNIPDGSIPLLSSAMGQKMSSFGLVPGVLGNIAYINPSKIFSAFDKETPCQQIKMPIRDILNRTSEEEKYVNNSDIKDYNPCWFSITKNSKKSKSKRINPVTGAECKEGMTTRTMHDDSMIKMYKMSVYLLGAYLLFRLVQK